MSSPAKRFNLCRIAILCAMTVAAGTAHAQATAATTPCKVLDPSLQVSYEGGCRDGLANGRGVARGGLGDYYNGEFVAGAKSGFGTRAYGNGDVYTGEWKADAREGRGTYVFGENSPWRGDRSEGEWVGDRRHGDNVYIFGPENVRMESQFFAGAPIGFAPPSIAQRQRALKVLAPVIGKPGAKVCSVTTVGSSPRNIARGTVTQVLDDRLQVLIETTRVIDLSMAKSNPRWDNISDWMPC